MRVSVALVTLALAGSSLALPAQRRDAVQDVGNALKTGADNVGLTEGHNALDAYLDGALKSFENDSGLTEASEGVGIQPYGLPITKRDAVQDIGNALKTGADNLGLTEAHNALDAYTDGALKSFENDSGLTEASEGVGIQPYGLPITKRQTLSGGASANITGNLGDFNSLADTIQAQFDALVAQLTGEFSQFTGTDATGASLPDASSLTSSFQAATAAAQQLEAKFQDLENQVEAAFQSLANAANVNLPNAPSLSGSLSGSGVGSVSAGGDDNGASNVSASTSNTGAAAAST